MSKAKDLALPPYCIDREERQRAIEQGVAEIAAEARVSYAEAVETARRRWRSYPLLQRLR